MEEHLSSVGLGNESPLFPNAVELDYTTLSSRARQNKTATRTQHGRAGARLVSHYDEAGTAARASQKSIVVHETSRLTIIKRHECGLVASYFDKQGFRRYNDKSCGDVAKWLRQGSAKP